MQSIHGSFAHATASGTRQYGRFSSVPRPFLRWVGSKQALLPHLVPHLPGKFRNYYEPFLGGGALFFHLRAKSAKLSDRSAELIGVWVAVRDHCDAIVEYLRPLRPDKELYYKIRENRSTDPIVKAAEFLYLNKTCWNGLYRVNSKGKFNVPYGRPRSDFIFDEENLRSCSSHLQSPQVELSVEDFCESTRNASAGDLIYFDPPYVTKHNNNGFRDWNEVLFSWSDQVRLADEAKRLAGIGAFVMISNADHQDIRDLYEGFSVIAFDRSSTLSSSARFRGNVGEIIAFAGD